MTVQEQAAQVLADLQRIENTQQFRHLEHTLFRLPSKPLQQAWNELQAVPSYVEQQAKAWAAELNIEIA